MSRGASAIMSKGTSRLVAAKTKLAALTKIADAAKKASDKALAAYEKAAVKESAQQDKVDALVPI